MIFKKQRVVLYFLTVVLLMNGCDLFSTRDPEDPANGPDISEIALSPEEVYIRLSESIQQRNPELHLVVIHDEFTYEASPAAYENPAFFLTWDYYSEDNFIRRLVATGLLPSDSTAGLTFTTVDENLWADSARFKHNYTLEIHTTREDLPVLYEGLLEIKMVRDLDGGWKILYMLDDAGGSNATMSRLRVIL